MAVRIPFDDISTQGGEGSATGLVDQGLGEAYEVVREVHEHLDDLAAVADASEDINEVMDTLNAFDVAYELALSQGYQGTKAEWLSSITLDIVDGGHY